MATVHNTRRSPLPLVALFTSLAFAQAPPRAVTMLEPALRQAAAGVVMPKYPAASLARRSEGVVVVRVRAGLDNRVERVDVVESPDADIAAAVQAAVSRWTFARRGQGGGPVANAAESRLTFYFRVRDGKGLVLNPDGMPGNEDVFASRTGVAPGGAGGPRSVEAPEPAVSEIDDATLDRHLSTGTAILLDVRNREAFAAGARPGAINIPAEELMVRAGAELARTNRVIIDCTRTETFRCYAGADALRRRGFEQVSIYLP